jgi:hypothetical protein
VRSRILREISLTCCAIAFIRQENLALIALLFLSALAGLAMFHSRDRLREVAKFSVTLLLPLFVWYSWTRYEGIEIPHGSHYVLPWQQWHWSLFGATLTSASHVLIEKIGYTAMIVAVGYIAARAILGCIRGTNPPLDQIDRASRVVAIAAAGLAFGNIAFLLFCYLATSFYPEEAETAISFWRFISQTGQALMIGFACIMPIGWLTSGFRGAGLLRLLPVVGFVLPVAVFPRYRDDLASGVPRLRMIADDMHRQLEDDKPIMLVDPSGNGFAALVVKYQMTVIEGDRRPIAVISEPHGTSPVQVRASGLPSDAYVWLAEGSPDFADTVGGDTSPGCSYLFTSDAGAYHLVKDWDVAPYHLTLGLPDDRTPMVKACAVR